MSGQKRIVITIDHLLLNGINARDVTSVTVALNKGLKQAVLNKGITTNKSTNLSSLPKQTFNVSDTGPGLGYTAGQVIYKTLGQGLKRGKI